VKKTSEETKRVEVLDLYNNQAPILNYKNVTLVRYGALTRKMLEALDKEDALVVITISPMEVHGNFLPLATDYLGGYYLIQVIRDLLTEKRQDKHYTIVDVPGLPIGTGSLRGVAGTLDIGHRTFRNCVIDYLDGLCRAGFKRFFLSSAHHGLSHAYALEEAASTIMKRFEGVRVATPVHWMAKTLYLDDPETTWTNIVQKFGQKPLSEQEMAALHADHHSAIMEICLIKKAAPNLVDSEEYKTSEPHIDGIGHQLKGMFSRRYCHHFGYEYNGMPAFADSRDWTPLFIHLIGGLCLEFVDALYADDVKAFDHFRYSHIWQFKFLKTNFKLYFIYPLILLLIVIPWILYFLAL